jgi:hypothetical protein
MIYVTDHPRSIRVCRDIEEGLRWVGMAPFLVSSDMYEGPVGDAAVFYGVGGKLWGIMQDYKRLNLPAMFFDLGYWSRKVPTRWEGFYRLSIWERHPNSYYRKESHDTSRWERSGLKLKPLRKKDDGVIVIAGMGDKAAGVYGLRGGEYEERVVRRLKELTDRPIVYRPKPSWKEAKPIDGTEFSTKYHSFDELLDRAWAVVTHHSNAAVDAIIAGVPVFCTDDGVGMDIGHTDIDLIETPHIPTERERLEWLSNVSYAQWHSDEIKRGLYWKHLYGEGLV